MTKQLISVMLLVLIPLAAYAAEDEEPAARIVTETEDGNVFRGSIYKVWLKLRSLTPKVQRDAGRGRVVVTAGIRGAESTQSTLQPYWKDDRTSDQGFIEQLKSFGSAQKLIDDGQLAEANTALKAFIEQYPESELRPNALFAQGLVLGATGDAASGIASLKQFIADYPKHPLKTDAETVLAEMDQG